MFMLWNKKNSGLEESFCKKKFYAKHAQKFNVIFQTLEHSRAAQSFQIKRNILSSSVRVLRLVVHYQLVVDEVEAVRLRFVRVVHHLFYCFVVQGGKLVYLLAGVARLGNAESEVEVEALQQPVFVVVALDHAELLHRFPANFKLHCGTDVLHFEKFGLEIVPDKSLSVGINWSLRKYLGHFLWSRLVYFKQSKICFYISSSVISIFDLPLALLKNELTPLDFLFELLALLELFLVLAICYM